jgi:hypothetical protein
LQQDLRGFHKKFQKIEYRESTEPVHTCPTARLTWGDRSRKMKSIGDTST